MSIRKSDIVYGQRVDTIKSPDVMAAAKAAKLNADFKQQDKRHKQIIRTFLEARDIPDWFRGTSKFQVTAANLLFVSIRDDMEQRTSHRVRLCLTALGLKPLISNSQIKFLMRLSRGSDLAFLWFLMEMYYKTPGPTYSVNEQLLMSTIAHLDMIPTLRELDRILPPGPKIKDKTEETPKTSSQEKLTRPKQKEKDMDKDKDKGKDNSPYLQTIRAPKPSTKDSTLKPPDFRVTLGEYDQWSDPNYMVQNEMNRWFATYEPRASKRIAEGILNEEIGKIFTDYDALTERADEQKTLCEEHKRLKALEDSLEVRLAVIAREQCRKYFDIDADKNAKRCARIRAQLEKDTEVFMRKFRSYTRTGSGAAKKTQVGVLSGDDDFYICDVKSSEEMLKDDQHHSEHRGNNKCDDSELNLQSGPCGACRNSVFNTHGCSFSCIHVDDCEHLAAHKRLKGNTNRPNGSNSRTRVSMSRCEDDITSVMPSSSKVFFVAAQEHQPWRFDYPKIFNPQQTENNQEVNVKQKIAEAMDSQMSFATKHQGALKPNVEKAMHNFVLRTWRKDVKAYNKANPQEICDQEALPVRPEDRVPIQFDRTTYDPDDHHYMLHMLKTAIEQMKKNHKFVLASLPDAHKLPLLKYFIQDRYGKRYSTEERQNLYRASLKIFRALDKVAMKVPMPSVNQLCTNLFVSYACRGYLLAKAARIKQEYYDKLDYAIMNQARIFWFAMRPYLCSSGPPRNTFYAYMPSRSMDITRFRQWKSSEYMDAKGEWERRQRKERQPGLK